MIHHNWIKKLVSYVNKVEKERKKKNVNLKSKGVILFLVNLVSLVSRLVKLVSLVDWLVDT